MSHLQVAIQALQATYQDSVRALEAVVAATQADDLTPLRNGLGLRAASARVGVGGDAPSVVVFGDLNRFKRINDDHGRLLQLYVEQGCGGKAFRQSGDEFVLLLTEAQLAQFLRVSASFACCPVTFDDHYFQVAMSFGYARSTGEEDFSQLRIRAEAACQVAKDQGDGVCVEWTPDLREKAVLSRRFRCAQCSTHVNCMRAP